MTKEEGNLEKVNFIGKMEMARSIVNTKDDQKSWSQVLKWEAMGQDIQADHVQSSSVVGEDTTQTINRRSHCHIINQKDFGGSEEEKQWKFDQTDGSKCKNMFDRFSINVRKVEVRK